MSRSRSFHLILVCSLVSVVFVSLVLASPAAAATAPSSPVWSPRLAYVLTTGSVRSVLSAKLHLTEKQDAELRAIGQDLERAQALIQRRSDLMVMRDDLTLEQKRELIAKTGYNETLESAEASATRRVTAVTGLTTDALGSAVQTVWQTDAATHNLETELSAMGLTAQSMVGAFHVYATRFYDEYADTFGVALPDKYVKYASLGKPNSGSTARPSGYPDGSYAVSLYWNGEKRDRNNAVIAPAASAHSVASAKVVDVGPWNTDDNWWNSYTDPQRPRRINDSGIGYKDVSAGGGGADYLAGRTHLAFGLPESQAAYFSYYARRSPIPGHTTAWENYWDKPRGYNGQWSGADQFGRQVTQPAAVDLTPPCYAALGLPDNEWIDVVPLWEARLDLVGSVRITDPQGHTVTGGPFITGQKLKFTYTVKNLGSLPGTWDYATYTIRTAGGAYKNPPYQGPFTLSPGQSRTFTFAQILDSAGTSVGFPQAQRADTWSHVGAQSFTFSNIKTRTVDRAAGDTRFETAVDMSRQTFGSGADSVVIATGYDFPDALTGASLAAAQNGPLLLVGPTAVPGSVEDELERLHPSTVTILGGASAVSTEVADHIASILPTAEIKRIAGPNRFATASMIATTLATYTGGKPPRGTVIVVNGRGFADALSASVMSAKMHWPILLTEKSALPSETAEVIKSLGATNTCVVGGTSSVSDPVKAKLPNAGRIAGLDRYATCAMVADRAEQSDIGAGYAFVGLASGANFPDALAGAVIAAHNGGTMLLTPPTGLPLVVDYRLQRHRTVTTHLQAFGGDGVVPLSVLGAAAESLR